jgi:hypothetical protein
VVKEGHWMMKKGLLMMMMIRIGMEMANEKIFGCVDRLDNEKN